MPVSHDAGRRLERCNSLPVAAIGIATDLPQPVVADQSSAFVLGTGRARARTNSTVRPFWLDVENYVKRATYENRSESASLFDLTIPMFGYSFEK